MATRNVGVIGTGNVGAAGAFAMVVREVADHVVLVDVNSRRAQSEATDLMHGQGLVGRIRVSSGDYSALSDCQVVVVTAGVAQKPGETRLQLLTRNAGIMQAIATELDRHAPDAVLVVASNPVDVLTYLLQESSKRPKEKILGTGTMLDTSRFRTLLGEYYGVNPQSVHGYILAEHGDSEFAAWSTVTIGGQPLVGNTVLGVGYDEAAMHELFVNVRDAAYQIIEGKGYTNWAIALVISKLVAIILGDTKTIQPVSVRLRGEYGIEGVCVSVPARVGRQGVEDIIELQLPPGEQAALEQSARLMKEGLSGLASRT
jgi:L-lactate dehydrogenase